MEIPTSPRKSILKLNSVRNSIKIKEHKSVNFDELQLKPSMKFQQYHHIDDKQPGSPASGTMKARFANFTQDEQTDVFRL